ncbi:MULTISPECIES: MBL fold metallo-hydrolase [unclassified Exiguobacterium]|uniref:MBL fold metallo-hydrolase n=1 Tax=unclassified Exiguobacterium TaxID=2644629 RepID=UPI00103ADE83|nr:MULTISPECIES: MBL fold metallo-hydrolase [unclassified Exiguobacterium]TCI43444.1 MBL fold metallo-hydrolase [Exiguobacterium sp. SH5S32]TCI52392.1 MBL fold metallo-hydrolase [Exiguobacterium sp. SH1S4]TCI68699.1 MBL fold metallo-hydrolase [Exiguobacterium sp. SH1S1]
MKVTRIEDVHQLTFYSPVLPINVQLIEKELGLVLIDTGLKQNAADILTYIEAQDRPLLAILLTHAHGDHVGGVDTILKAHPHAELYVSRRDARLLAGDRTTDSGERPLNIRGSLPPIRSLPDKLLDPGERLFGLRVYAAAGHTPGSIAYFDEHHRLLFAGDAFQSHGGVAVAGDTRPLFPLPGLATWDKRAAVEHAERLLDLAPRHTFVGHGKALEGTHRLYLALKRAKRKQARRFSR